MKNPLIVTGLVVSLLLASGLSLFASSQPDGFEKAAGKIGFLETAEESPLKEGNPLYDYKVASVKNENLSGALAGVIGVTSTAAVSFGIFFAMRRFGKLKS
jgi:hypothetical protein